MSYFKKVLKRFKPSNYKHKDVPTVKCVKFNKEEFLRSELEEFMKN